MARFPSKTKATFSNVRPCLVECTMDSILTDFLAAALRLGTSLAPLQLAPCSFQYTTSTPPGFTTEIQSDKVSVRNSVRLKLKTQRTDKIPSRAVVFQFVIVVQLVQSVPSARFPHGVFHGRPPFDDRLPVFPTVARHSPPPSSAARDAASRGRGRA
jgi:hypothetical protein